MNIKRSLLVGAAVATVGLSTFGGASLVSAASATPTSSTDTSLVDKIASKFGLAKTDVQAVFDADRTEHEAERKADQKERLAQAVTDGKITQAQADYITAAMEEIDTLHGTGSPEDEKDAIHEQVKAKMDTLRTWAEDNNVDMRYVGLGGGHGGPGGDGKRFETSDSDSADAKAN